MLVVTAYSKVSIFPIAHAFSFKHCYLQTFTLVHFDWLMTCVIENAFPSKCRGNEKFTCTLPLHLESLLVLLVLVYILINIKSMKLVGKMISCINRDIFSKLNFAS